MQYIIVMAQWISNHNVVGSSPPVFIVGLLKSCSVITVSHLGWLSMGNIVVPLVKCVLHSHIATSSISSWSAKHDLFSLLNTNDIFFSSHLHLRCVFPALDHVKTISKKGFCFCVSPLMLSHHHIRILLPLKLLWASKRCSLDGAKSRPKTSTGLSTNYFLSKYIIKIVSLGYPLALMCFGYQLHMSPTHTSLLVPLTSNSVWQHEDNLVSDSCGWTLYSITNWPEVLLSFLPSWTVSLCCLTPLSSHLFCHSCLITWHPLGERRYMPSP